MDKLSSVSPVAEKDSSSKDNRENIMKEPRNEDSMSNGNSRPADFLGKDCSNGTVKGGANASEVVVSGVMERAVSAPSTVSTNSNASRRRGVTRSSLIKSKSYGDLLTGTNGILSSRKKGDFDEFNNATSLRRERTEATGWKRFYGTNTA